MWRKASHKVFSICSILEWHCHASANPLKKTFRCQISLLLCENRSYGLDLHQRKKNYPTQLDSCNVEFYVTILKATAHLGYPSFKCSDCRAKLLHFVSPVTWLHANMGEERLTGLARLPIHQDILIEPVAVIVRFSTTRCRQEFVL